MENITDKIDKRKQPVPPEVAAERKERANQTRGANNAFSTGGRQGNHAPASTGGAVAIYVRRQVDHQRTRQRSSQITTPLLRVHF